MSQVERLVFSLILGFCCLMGLVCFGVPIFAWLTDAAWELNSTRLLDPSILAITRFTIWQMLWSTLISTGIGLALGLIVGRWATQARSGGLLSGFLVPLAVPTLVSALGWMSFIGQSYGILYTQKAVILAHCFYNIPLVVYWVAQARRSVRPQLLFAVRSLGGSAWDEWRVVVWPKIKWPLWSAAAQTASFCAMSFALVLILGGGPPVQSLETEVFYRLRFGEYDPAGALSCAVWEFLLTLFPWAGVIFAESQRRKEEEKLGTPLINHDLVSVIDVKTKMRFSLSSNFRQFGILFGLGSILLFFLAPYFFVLSPGAFYAFRDREFLRQLWSSLRVSLGIAFLTSSFVSSMSAGLILSLRSSHLNKKGRAMIQFLAAAPGGVSVLILALGVWIAYGKWIDPFEGSLSAIVVIQSCIFFPLAFRFMWPLLSHEDQISYQAAWSLGASWWDAFLETEWPQLRIPLLAIWSGIFGACLGEVAGVSLFGSSKWMTLSLLLTHKMQHYRFEEAQAIAALLFLLSMSSMGMALYFWSLQRKQSQ